MSRVGRGVWLVSMIVGTLAGWRAAAQVPTTTVQDTVYYANGTPAQGTVLLSWNAFITANGASIAAGNTSVTLGAGGSLSVALAPNLGSTPMGNYYTAVYHLNDGETTREFWVVPVNVPGGGPAKLAGIRNQVLPTSVAMQTVTKQYVDDEILAAQIAPIPLDSSPYVLKTGDTMTGPLVLPEDPTSALQAADKNYVDENVAVATSALNGGSITSGTVSAARLPLFGPSGTTHAAGIVPDPGATAGSTRFLREDGMWNVPAGGGSSSGMASGDLSGSYPGPTVSAVHATSGTVDGVTIGATAPAVGSFTTATAAAFINSNVVTSISPQAAAGSGASATCVDVCTANSGWLLINSGTGATTGIQIILNLVAAEPHNLHFATPHITIHMLHSEYSPAPALLLEPVPRANPPVLQRRLPATAPPRCNEDFARSFHALHFHHQHSLLETHCQSLETPSAMHLPCYALTVPRAILLEAPPTYVALSERFLPLLRAYVPPVSLAFQGA